MRVTDFAHHRPPRDVAAETCPTRLPIGFSPGQSSSATARLSTATGDECSSSDVRKQRPRIKGMPMCERGPHRRYRPPRWPRVRSAMYLHE